MNTIVVGIDGTEASLLALDWAAERAARGGTRIEIVMVAGSTFTDDFRIDASILTAERRLRDRVPDVEVASRRVAGRMPESLLEHAKAADLLVIGSHRDRPLRSARTGWMPMRIASHSSIPVVVVPDNLSRVVGPVVVGIDDDDSSRAAMGVAAGEADAGGFTLAVVHAWQMPAPRIEGSVALLASPIQVRAQHRGILRAAALEVSLIYPDLHIEQVLVQENAARVLLTRSDDASLLVIGSHHRRFLARALLGSVGQHVLSQSSVAVCVAPNIPRTAGLRS
jgi:nucleotide-binding universal stress UspA family protein